MEYDSVWKKICKNDDMKNGQGFGFIKKAALIPDSLILRLLHESELEFYS
jgi:hypothetical protein